MQAKWIWLNDGECAPDSYATFKTTVNVTGEITLKVSCDGIYAAYLNGELVLFSVCADYPHYKLYDETTITAQGESELSITVWYPGTDSQTYIHSNPGLWFEVSKGGTVIAASGTDTLGRVESSFKQSYCFKYTMN